MIEYGNIKVDETKLSQGNLVAMISRGVKHYLGNEVSSRVGASFRADAVAAWKAGNVGTELTADQRKVIEGAAIPESDSPEYVARKAKITQEFLDVLLTGEVGVSDRAPSVDPFTAMVNSIVKRDVLAILRSQKGVDDKPLWSGKADPKNDTEFTFAKGKRTFAEVKDAFLAKHQGKVEGEAKKRIEADAKAKAAAEKLAAENDIESMI